MSSRHYSNLGIVAIGRNEGERLRQCLTSLPPHVPTVYVDSGSTDDSCKLASELGANLVLLDQTRPFTAARARNAGLRKLLEIAPDTSLVQFIDGDCTLAPGWLDAGVSVMETRPKLAVVCGRCREKFPERSIYNRMCDEEWDTPIGDGGNCGGNALMRRTALDEVQGFRDDLIAGEEPELCVRLRSKGWGVFRVDAEMVAHDANMLHFSQWWRRTIRNGYAYAEGAFLHGAGPSKHWRWEAKRAWIWAVAIPVLCLLATFLLWPWGLLFWMVFPLQIVKQVIRNPGDTAFASKLAAFQLLGRFAELIGQVRYHVERTLKRRARLIEYK